MAKCSVCNCDMSDRRVLGCDRDTRQKIVPLLKDGVEHAPVLFPPETSTERCHDCNAVPGHLHHFGCDMELCPLCGGQLISCGCFDECMEHLCDDDDEDDT